ncbi:MAG: hypothetical protein IJX46_02140 [Clostridia bacterium]|nr:hypothetical protein [Clostridia bacterium]
MRKLKGKKAPLSALDKFIYFALILLDVGLFVFIMWFFLTMPVNIAFMNERTVAAEPAAALLCFFSLIVFPWVFAVPVCMMISRKQPIFGNKKFKPKRGERIIMTYPLFSDDFKKHVWPEKKKKVILYTSIVSGLLAVSIAISLFAIYPRRELDSDGKLYTYNSFNELVDERSAEDAQKIKIIISNGTGMHPGPNRRISIWFEFGDQSRYSFGLQSFEKMSTIEALEYLIYLKSLYRDKVEIGSTKDMPYLLRDRKYTGREKELVYELFDYH